MAEDHFRYKRFKKNPGKFHDIVATVMFIDIVGFTKRGDNEALRAVVRSLQDSIIDVFANIRWDELNGPNGAIMLPTGDGYGIGFDPSIVHDREVLQLAEKLSIKLASSGTPIRMGINKGHCWVHRDLNDKLNLAGWGIIDAQRAMSCGGKNHILCTEQFAQPYLEVSKDASLHPLGDFTPKDRSLRLFNYYSKKFGNAKNPTKPAKRQRSRARRLRRPA
jgi:hypothetical protein